MRKQTSYQSKLAVILQVLLLITSSQDEVEVVIPLRMIAILLFFVMG